MQKYADPTEPTNVRGKVRPSSLWTRAVYYEGLMGLYSISPRDEYYDYTYRWCDFHKWQPRHGDTTRDADDYCCGQTYIDMYRLEPESFKLRHVLANAEMLVNIPAVDDWWWIDAIQMGMPYLAKLGRTTGDTRYWDKMWAMYEYTRNQQGEAGMWNAKDGLWWRDRDFDAPYTEPNGEDCYWSRGNGWVVAALVRVMDEIPTTEPHYKQYLKDFQTMCKALKACQREDGFWNCSLHDETHYGGKETSGTALFVYGMAWGIRQGYLKSDDYLPVVTKAWNAMVRDAVHDDGFLGYVQGTGKEPKDGQPTTYTNAPDFEDYGVGCFLLAGTEVYKIAPVEKDPVTKK
jgi:rhamnogalacturonyl hydrolase YesR